MGHTTGLKPMSKTQAFEAFALIMRCMFWILYRLSYSHKYDARLFEDEVDKIITEYANFMAKESPENY